MIEPIESQNKSVAKLLDKLLEKHDNLLDGKVGLNRDDVVRLTAKMKRENFKPQMIGAEVIREFLEAGFKDITVDEVRQYGVNPQLATNWVRHQHDIVIQQRGDPTMGHGSVFNLAKDADRFPLKKNEKPGRKKTKAPNPRSCHEQRLARKAANRSKGKGTIHEQSGAANP